jgi:hypothetical protein
MITLASWPFDKILISNIPGAACFFTSLLLTIYSYFQTLQWTPQKQILNWQFKYKCTRRDNEELGGGRRVCLDPLRNRCQDGVKHLKILLWKCLSRVNGNKISMYINKFPLSWQITKGGRISCCSEFLGHLSLLFLSPWWGRTSR